MIDLRQYEVWFVTGGQDLYGPETLKQVAVAQGLGHEGDSRWAAGRHFVYGRLHLSF